MTISLFGIIAILNVINGALCAVEGTAVNEENSSSYSCLLDHEAKGSFFLCTLLLALFILWRLSAASFAVRDITTLKVECLYWAAILFSNTLGTALGDFLVEESHLGFGGSSLLIAGLLGLIVLATFFTRISQTLLFWIAFVLTRPFGVTVGDLLTKSRGQGGLGFGTIGSSFILGSILVLFILWTGRSLFSGEANAQGRNERKLGYLMRFRSGSGGK